MSCLSSLSAALHGTQKCEPLQRVFSARVRAEPRHRCVRFAKSHVVSFFQGRRDRLDAFRRGDRQILAELFCHSVKDVSLVLRQGFQIRHVRVRGVNDVDRERELTQEVFLRAFSEKSRLAYNGLTPYRPYLVQIARNLLIDQARAAGTSPERVSDEELAEFPSLEPEAADVLQQNRLRAATQAFCSKLPERLQRFVRLRFEEGLSQHDAAQALGVSRRQIRTWEGDVRAQLSTALQAQGLMEESDENRRSH